jgi:starch-binding outer membrane protein, SusD/RagB family
MTNFRKVLTLLIGIPIIFLGCTDLSENLMSDISAEEHYSTAEGIHDLTVAMYDPLYEYYGYEAGEILTVPGTDEFTYAQGRRGLWNDYSAALNPTEDDARGMLGIWNEFFRGINLTNSVLARIDDATGVTDAQRLRWTAEARFLRGYYYHILVQHFGGVHLTLEETIGVETEAHRVSENEIWEVVVDDFLYAIDNLPLVQTSFGRATKNAARHALAKTYLILENWQDAADLAIEIIDSGQHSLLDNFADVFDPYNQEHEEVIWSVVRNFDTRVRRDARTARDFGMRQHTIQGVRADNIYGSMTSRYLPTRFLIEEIFGNDPDNGGINYWNDTRYHASFKEVFYYNDEANLPPGAAVGDTAWYGPTALHYQQLTDQEAAQKGQDGNYIFMRMEDWTDALYTSMIEKFRHPDIQMYWGRNVIVMRLAETYLIAAEALMMDGRLNEAADYLNEVRLRAQAPGQQIPLIAPEELNIDEILNERSRELAGETMRWKDLKRTGKLLERVRAYNDRAAPNIQEHHLLRPIPQSQIDRTTNNYPQNPGY